MADRPNLIFHLVAPGEWAAAQAAGEYRPPSLETEGFVHFSFADQVTGSANRFYRDVAEMVVLEVDPDVLSAPLRVEDTYRTGAEFPHVYGPIPLAAVRAVHPLRRGPTGEWDFEPAV